MGGSHSLKNWRLGPVIKTEASCQSHSNHPPNTRIKVHIKILALDLGKFNSVACFFNSKTRKSKFLTTRTTAVWSAVERACTTGDFRPRQSKLCDWCSFQRWCPAFGGDPSLAATEAVAAHEALLAEPVASGST